LLNALNALRGKMTAPHELAREAIRIEQHVIKESVGSQDQVWAAIGGLGTITFQPSGDFELKPLIIASERVKALNDCMMLFYSGQSRFASAVAAEKIENLAKRERQLHRMREFVDEGVQILQQANRQLDDLGRLLHESWKLKKELASGVTTSRPAWPVAPSAASCSVRVAAASCCCSHGPSVTARSGSASRA
jgi:D-glycero-alpha-D-manno-heptose-7-phosphate kinase